MDTGLQEQLPKKELVLTFSQKSVANFKHPERNEDAVFQNGRDLAMVLDGLGRLAHGEKASQVAKDFIADNLAGEETDVEVAKKHLVNVITEASKTVKSDAEGGMTTIVVAKIVNTAEGKVAVIGNVGDSRAYLLHDGKLRLITKDDRPITEEMEAVCENATSAADLSEKEKAAFKKSRYIVLQCLGGDLWEVHLNQESIDDGDKLVLTSDGIHDNLTFYEIEEIIKGNRDVAVTLVDKAHARSAENHFRSKLDDISAVVIEVN